MGQRDIVALLADLFEKYNITIRRRHLLLLERNPEIFVYDYDAMRESHMELKEELIMKAWHPDRVARILELGLDPDDL